MKYKHGKATVLFALLIACGQAEAQKGTVSWAPSSHDAETYQSDLAEVYISIIGVRSLDAVIDELQPTFSLSSDQALQRAVPDTLNSSESTLSSFKTALQVGLMFGLSDSTNASSAAASAQPSPLSILSNLPPGTLSVDPVSTYQAGASFYEQVKLLNRSLQDVPHFKGYTPYIVTIQVALIPHKRDSPYDAYANIGFFTDTNEPPDPPGTNSQTIPLIFPLLTTDALEAANDQQNLNQLRQLTATISAAAHGVGAKAGVDQLNQTINSLYGLNLNSLLTVGKLNQNCMVVRLGARNQPGSKDKYSLVPQTHNVSLLILARSNAKELQMVARTIFRNVLDGTSKRDMNHDKRNALFIDNVMESYLLHKRDAAMFKNELLARPNEGVDKEFYPYMWHLINDVYDTNSVNSDSFLKFRRDFEKFFKNSDVTNSEFTNFFNGKRHPPFIGDKTTPMKDYHDFYTNLFDMVWFDSLWLDVARSGAAEQYANDLIPLPTWTPHLPSEDQEVLCKDDGQSTILSLVNETGAVPSTKIMAQLRLIGTNSQDTNVVLYSRQVTATSDGTSLNIQFPSISTIARYKEDGTTNTNRLSPYHLRLTYGQDANNDAVVTSNYTNVAILLSAEKDAKPPLPWKIDRTYGSLAAGLASNVFTIVLATNKSSEITKSWFLDVASPRVFTNDSPTNGVLDQRTNGLYHLKLPASNLYEVTFTLGPLQVGQSVDFNLLDNEHTVKTNMHHEIVYPASSSQTNSQAGASNRPNQP